MTTPLSEVLTGEPVEQAPVLETETNDTETSTQAEPIAEPTGDLSAPPAEETKVDYETQLKLLKEQLDAATAKSEAMFAKAQDEKYKRQQYERQFQSNTPPPEKISVFDDEDAAINQRVQPVLNQFDARFNNMSEDMARRLHPDYDDKFEVFQSMAAHDPSLVMQLRQSANPAMFAYDKATEYQAMQSMKSIDNLSEVTQLAKELKEAGGLDNWRKNQAEIIKKQIAEQTMKQTVQNIPPSLAKVTAVGGTGGSGFAGATPLDQIIGEKAR